MAESEETAAERPLAAFYLGLLEGEDHTAVERAIRSDPELRERCAAWPTAIAAITCASLVLGETNVEARLEQRLIQRARIERPPTVRSRSTLRTAGRGIVWLGLVGLVAIAVLFGYLAFRADDPISGRAVGLTEDGVTGVLLPRYEDRLFALIFWGLPQLESGDAWQLWLVRESGAVEAGPTFVRDEEGRAAVSINPNLLETEDTLIGFAVSIDNPSERVDGTPSADDILYQFSRN
jgi:anti-sigma-K factor RskA